MSDNKLRMVVLDMDGTLLDSQHEISSRTLTILRKLSSLGITICIATGRNIAAVTQYVNILNLPQKTLPVVCMNGSHVACWSNTGVYEGPPRPIVSRPLEEHSSRRLIDFASRLGLGMQYYNINNGDLYTVPLHDEHNFLLAKYTALTGVSQIVVESYDEAISQAGAAKILIFTSDVDALLAAAHSEGLHEHYHIIRGSPHPFFVEFLVHGVCKGHSVKLLCEHMGVKAEEIVAFGDGDNDKEMLQFAGVGVAMKNAKYVLKEVADVVLEWSNDEEGVAAQLERMESSGRFYQLGGLR